ncbi:MAG: chemotaxis response regulator protein-glutamate methylesterase [Rhodospirillales bacterium]|nr:chemotaxis response regulator protein-glutamate methylesterase [Rhodospirillales bacterium]
MSKQIRVLVVDDSALVRQILTSVLSADPGIEVVGVAVDPFDAREKIKVLNPDVITLDVEMPRMSGLDFLEKLMRLRPMPVVMVSTLTQKGAEATIEALSLGAVDFVAKPTSAAALGALGEEIVGKIRNAASTRVRPFRNAPKAERPAAVPTARRMLRKLIAIGSSTGGVEAVTELISGLPNDSPPVVITQHMPPHYTASFAQRLDKTAQVRVHEATDGQKLQRGHVYIAPGGRHLKLDRFGEEFRCVLNDDAPVTGHRPSVDVLFHSVAEAAGKAAVGVILTGMGRDGAQGLKNLRDHGANTFGQDELSCVVYGMPRAAKEVGAVEQELPLGRIAQALIRACLDTGQ